VPARVEGPEGKRPVGGDALDRGDDAAVEGDLDVSGDEAGTVEEEIGTQDLHASKLLHRLPA
jgi:hypothetical protein